MRIDIVTIFPDFFRGPLDHGIVRRAQEAGLLTIAVHDLRAFAHDRHKTVDDRPFGGGEGMVLKPEPIFECIDKLELAPREERLNPASKQSVILLSAQGTRFDQQCATGLSRLEQIVLICGRYEGIDERVGEHLADCELSIGDYVLSGGEVAAAVMIDTVTRLIPGALGNQASSRHESFGPPAETEVGGAPDSTCASGGLLDYPHYTRPADFRGWMVPEVLGSGNHAQIRRWRRRTALEKTLRNRPELLNGVELSQEDQRLLAQIRGGSSEKGERLKFPCRPKQPQNFRNEGTR
jgi:tRNA (guanine37-N1)-methyltransferase